MDNNVNGLVDVQDVGPNAEASHLCLGINPGPYTSGCFGVEFKEFAFCVEICNDVVDNNANGRIDENPCSRDPLRSSDSKIISKPPPILFR